MSSNRIGWSLGMMLACSAGALAQEAALAAEGKQPQEFTPRSETKEERRTERVIDNSKYYLGGDLGIGLISEGGGGHPGFGGVLGVHWSRDLSAGFFFSRVPRGSFSSNEASGTEVGGSINYYGLEAQYHIERIPGLQMGLKTAIGDNRVEINNTSTSSTDLYYGPKLGYDFAFSERMTIGAEASVLFSAAENARSTAELIASLKYWFA